MSPALHWLSVDFVISSSLTGSVEKHLALKVVSFCQAKGCSLISTPDFVGSWYSELDGNSTRSDHFRAAAPWPWPRPTWRTCTIKGLHNEGGRQQNLQKSLIYILSLSAAVARNFAGIPEITIIPTSAVNLAETNPKQIIQIIIYNL